MAHTDEPHDDLFMYPREAGASAHATDDLCARLVAAAEELLTTLDLDPAAMDALRDADQTGEIIEAIDRLRAALDGAGGVETKTP
jgi:hypothetical protein